MPDRIPCEFFLIRYVPDPVKGEFANIGVLLREASQPGTAAQLRFTRDWAASAAWMPTPTSLCSKRWRAKSRRVCPDCCNRPQANSRHDRGFSFSNSIQITEPRACLAEILAAELDLLMKMYVEPLRVASGTAAAPAAPPSPPPCAPSSNAPASGR